MSDKSDRPPLMAGAAARVRAMQGGEEETPTRPNPIAGPARPVPPVVVGALFVMGLIALYLLFVLLSGGGPAPAAPRALPTVAAPAQVEEAEQPAPAVEQPAPPPLPTGESYLIGTEPAPAVQLAPQAPAAPAVEPVYSELVPLVEAPTPAVRSCADVGRGPCRGGRP